MNWDDLRIFLAIARDGSLSAAAKSLRVTQPTVGRRLRTLEETLGARLFDRMPEGLVPTAAGGELLPLAEAVEQAAHAVDRRQPALVEEARGTVRLSVWEIFGQFLADHLIELRQRLPEIEIEISVTHSRANLVRREADLLIQECLPENPGLIARKIASHTYAVYGERTLVARYPAATTEARFRDCPWAGYDEDHTYFPNQAWMLERLEDRNAAIRVNNGIMLHEAVRKGAGLGVLPCFAGDQDPALVRLTPPIDELTRKLHLVVHQDLRRSPAVRAVMEVLIEIYRREQPRLLGQIPAAA